MVWESFLGVNTEKRKGYEFFLMGIVYGTIALLVSLLLFRTYASFLVVIIVVMETIPLVFNYIQYDRGKDVFLSKGSMHASDYLASAEKPSFFFGYLKYGEILKMYGFVFLGIIVAFIFWHVVLPSSVTAPAFPDTNYPNALNQTANSSFGRVMLDFGQSFIVSFLSLLFTLFFGSGAMLILSWNAMIITGIVRDFLMKLSAAFSFSLIASFGVVMLPKILGFALAGLAGGVISVGVIRYELGSREFKGVMSDSVKVYGIGLVLLLISSVTGSLMA
ncbi:hypothetical protein HZB02_02950 [Candidatus Woesearchaeota archaeon]|nr:hypothetical protein [Candidatus Woesearchaeota archaeon]